MIFLTALIALLLFIYLFVALVRPEWFWTRLLVTT